MKYESSMLKNVFDIVPVNIVILDENASICFINKTALSLINKGYEDSVGRHFGDCFCCKISYENPEGCGYGSLCKNCEIKNVLSIVYETGQTIEGMELNKKLVFDGVEVEFWFKVSVTAITVDGKRNAVITLMDITEKAAEKKLREQEELFRTVFEQTPIGIILGNEDKNIINLNPKFEEITGRSKAELLKLRWTHYTHPDDIQNDLDNFIKFRSGEINGYSIIKRYIKPDGSIVCVNFTLAPLKIGNQSDSAHLCMIEDITERIQTELDLRESERSKAMLLSNLPGIAYRCSYDKDWTIQFISDGCYDLTGYKAESLVYNRVLSFNDLINPEYREYLWKKWDELLPKRGTLKEEYSITTATGEVKWVYEQGRGVYDDDGNVIALEGLIIDITDRKMKEDKIKYLNYHDVLTGLYNRRFFEEKIKALDQQNPVPISIIIGDINGLKQINDALGHSVGDKLIVAMSKIIEGFVSEIGIVARTGGDDFSIILPKTENMDAIKLMNRIHAACNDYISKANDVMYHTSMSFGCATKDNITGSMKDTIKNAEDIMYRNKMLQNKSMHSSVLSSMKRSLLEKSQETEEHALRLINYSMAIGQRMALTYEQLNELELLATLHDIGKIGISDSIINKPDMLTDEERILMNKHPEIGYRIAITSKELLPIAEYILCHHERYDGKGYPQGLKGDDIPLLSRIIAVVDAYDAMTEDRPYRKAMTKKAAIKEIRRNSGTQFDPKISDIFISILEADC